MKIKHLVLDLETDSFDVNKANVKVFGLYDLDNNKFYMTTDAKKALDIIKSAEFIITYNGKEYDMPILMNQYKLRVKAEKHIDLYQIFKKRQSVISKKPFSNFKLKTIIEELKIDEVGKLDIDYKVFKKNTWTEEEKKEIAKYLKQDLVLTAKAWEYLKKRFEPFKEFMSKKDVDNYKHINTSMGAYTYKVVCNVCKLDEEYDFDTQHAEYEGAYVQKPIKEFVRGNIICFDFASLYPQMYVHANLFSHHCTCCSQNEKWDGGKVFDIKGSYCGKNQGNIEKFIKQMYLLRKEYKKKKDEREQVVKIIINSLYGVSGSPIFKSLYNLNTAQDCTALGRQCVKYAINKFNKSGFIVLYGDTDSCYVEIPEGKTRDEAIEVSKQVTKELSNSFPFPWEEFNLKVEDDMKYITFFRDEKENFKKKNYIYVTKDNKLTIKGLQIIKKDCSAMSKKIFKKHIKNNIIEKLICKYDREEIINWIYNELNKDIGIAAKQFSIKNKEDYVNETSIQSMILEKYGPGEHKMIKNKYVGVGKGVKYCTIEEARKLNIQQIDIDIFLKELRPFIKKDVKTELGDFT